MNLSKRIKKIVSLTVEDWYNQGYSTDETHKELRERWHIKIKMGHYRGGLI